MNIAILLFNLVPAFPLDGGRIARAIAWRRTGDRNRATRITAIIGQWFAYLVIGFGVFVAIQVQRPDRRHPVRDARLLPAPGGDQRPGSAARSPSAWRA